MNNTMVREIRGAKINPKSSFKNQGAQNTRGRKLREQIRYSNSLSSLRVFLNQPSFCHRKDVLFFSSMAFMLSLNKPPSAALTRRRCVPLQYSSSFSRTSLMTYSQTNSTIHHLGQGTIRQTCRYTFRWNMLQSALLVNHDKNHSDANTRQFTFIVHYMQMCHRIKAQYKHRLTYFSKGDSQHCAKHLRSPNSTLLMQQGHTTLQPYIQGYNRSGHATVD